MLAYRGEVEFFLRAAFVVYFISNGVCTDMPRFAYKSEDCRLILSESSYWFWHAGCPNSIAVLKENILGHYKLKIHINTEGDIISQRVSFLITCPGSSSPIKIRLQKNNTKTATFCKSEKFPAKLQYDASSDQVFEFLLERAESLHTFHEHLSISIEVEAITSSGKTVALKSNPVHVYRSNSILIGNQGPYHIDILTSQGKHFLKSSPYPSMEKFPQIQFLNKDFIARVQSEVLGTFLENIIEVGALLDFESHDCTGISYPTSKPALVLTVMNRISSFGHDTGVQIYYHLNLADGMLMFSRAGISNVSNSKASASEARIIESKRMKVGSICTYLSLNALTQQRQYLLQHKYTDDAYELVDYKDFSRKSTCIKATNVNVEELILFAGIPRYALKCPIICDFDVALEFKHGTKTLPTSRGRSGKLAVNHNFLVFRENLKASDSGIYTCSYRDSSVDLQHTFNVSVVSLPAFQRKENPKQDGSLPPVIYAVEGESLSYSCAVFYHGLPVTLAPEIFHSSFSHGWSGPLSDSDYNSYLFVPGATESTVKDDRRIGASTLTVNVKKVPSMDRSTMRNFTHRFHCKASVQETDKHLRILNMKDYTVVSGSNVVYIPKPTSSDIIASPHNQCSRGECNSEAGASFSFKFSSDFAAYIRKIGVKVTGYFMLGDLNVASIPVIRPEYSTLNEGKDFELKLTIPTITEDLLSELQKRKTLTAVYNFNYNSNELHAGLQLEKSKYGKARDTDDEDCRSDKSKTCFYSTSFPALVNDSSLNFLTRYIYFL